MMQKGLPMTTEHTNARAARLRDTLTRHFAPTRIEITDDSARHAGHAGVTESHAGHAGASGAGETHYSVLVISEAFAGLSRVARHRAVNAALDSEFQSGLHALSLVLKTPAETHGKS